MYLRYAISRVIYESVIGICYAHNVFGITAYGHQLFCDDFAYAIDQYYKNKIMKIFIEPRFTPNDKIQKNHEYNRSVIEIRVRHQCMYIIIDDVMS